LKSLADERDMSQVSFFVLAQMLGTSVPLLAASGVGLAIFLASTRPPEESLIVVFPLLVAAVLLASLWVFRGLGHRLVWRRSRPL